ncbi:MAG: hypothetical protein R3F31_03120 [Verrucomicrobiales bacterium]
MNLLGDGIVGIAQGCPATVPQAFLGAFRDLVGDALRDHLPLELAEGKQHVEHEHSHRRTGVESLRGRNEVDLVLVEDFPELVEVRQIAGDAVQLVGHHHVHLPGLHLLNERLHSGPFEVLSRISGIIQIQGCFPAFMEVNRNGVLADVALAFE